MGSTATDDGRWRGHGPLRATDVMGMGWEAERA